MDFMDRLTSSVSSVASTVDYIANIETAPGFGFRHVIDSRSAWKVWAWGTPPIIIFGTVGNILSALVMNRKSLKASTTSLYLTVLAVCDAGMLYFGLVPQWLHQLFNIEYGHQTGCQAYWSLLYFTSLIEAWVLVTVTLERFTAVWFPTKHKSLFTKKRALLILAITVAIATIESSHLYYTMSADCRYLEQYMTFNFVIYPWTSVALRRLLPFCIMLTLDVAIIIKLVRNSRRLGTTNKVGSMTTILLTVTFTFLLLNLPICVYVIAGMALSTKGKLSAQHVHLLVHTRAYVNMLYYLNYAINFLLYCLSGRKFRQELRGMLGLQNTVATASSGTGTTHN